MVMVAVVVEMVKLADILLIPEFCVVLGEQVEVFQARQVVGSCAGGKVFTQENILRRGEVGQQFLPHHIPTETERSIGRVSVSCFVYGSAPEVNT